MSEARRLERTLNDRLQKAYGRADLRIRGPLVRSAGSKIFKAEGEPYSSPVAVKICLDEQSGKASGEAAEGYFSTLKRLSAMQDDLGVFAVATPLDAFFDLGAVIIEWVPGPRFSTFVRRASRTSATHCVRQAGGWLAHLHKSGMIERRPLDTATMLAQLDRTIASSGLPSLPPRIARSYERLRDAASQASEVDVMWASIHGDFKPDNLIVCGNRLTGIDIESKYYGPGVIDAAHFLNHLSVANLVPFRRHRGAEAELGSAFLSGYADAGGTIPTIALKWTRLQNALRLFVNHAQWSRPPKSFLTRIILNRLIGNLDVSLARENSQKQFEQDPAR